MLAMKFGGTSVGSAERIKIVADIIKNRVDKKPVVVCSAVGGITDKLIAAANAAAGGKVDTQEIDTKHIKILTDLELELDIVKDELEELKSELEEIKTLKEVSPKSWDTIVSFGERMSVKIVAAYLNKIGVKSESFNAYDIGMELEGDHGNGDIVPAAYDELRRNIEHLDIVPIITGFIGKTKDGDIITFGRGGSDYTCALIGAAISAEEIQIWTDVHGVMSTDPRVVENAKTINELSFPEASELAYFGAKVLHPKTILPAVEKGITVRVLNTYDPDHPGTAIMKETTKKDTKHPLKAIAFKRNINLIRVVSTRMLLSHGFMAHLFNVFEKHKVCIDMVATSEVSVSLSVDKADNLDKLRSDLSEFSKVAIEPEKALVCVVGEGMAGVPGTAAKIFNAVAEAGISMEMISQGASEVNVSFIIDNKDVENAVQALHKEFFD
ncbi:aspartate kinase [Nanoarchaeota archaeon]